MAEREPRVYGRFLGGAVEYMIDNMGELPRAVEHQGPLHIEVTRQL